MRVAGTFFLLLHRCAFACGGGVRRTGIPACLEEGATDRRSGSALYLLKHKNFVDSVKIRGKKNLRGFA